MTPVDARWRELLAADPDPAGSERDAALIALRLVRAGLGAGKAAEVAKLTVLGLAGHGQRGTD